MAKREAKHALSAAACGCGSRGGALGNPQHAAGVDPELKAASLNRLRRIEGQVRGLVRMIEEERYCADVIVQISAVRESLLSVSRVVMKNHLKHCATEAIGKGEKEAEAMYEELLELMTTLAK